MLLYYGTLPNCGVKHALMREVADLESGNFRGVCPILNRAKSQEVYKGSCGSCIQRQSVLLSGIVCDPSNAGFIMRSKEKHGAL